MRIACDGCDAKYAISDDKVSGKVFKIRCKKCGHVIVTRAAPALEQPAWHAMIGDDQVGPMTSADVAARVAAGEIDADTIMWRDGMDGWLPLSAVDDLARLVATRPRDPFARPDSEPPADAPRADKLRGERNESSVLFSVHTLGQLAPKAAAGEAPRQEGSGLLDIRSMASAFRGTAAAKPAAPAEPVFEAFAGFAEPIAIAIVPPVRAASHRMLYATCGAIGALAIAVVVTVIVLAGNGGASAANQPAHPQAAPGPQGAQIAAVPSEPAHATAPATSSETPHAAPSDASSTPADTTHATHAAVSHPATTQAHTTTAAHVRDHATTATTSTTVHATTTTTTTPPPPPATCDEVSCVLDNYKSPCCTPFKKLAPTPDTHVRSELPDALDASMISAGVGAIRARVDACGGRSSAKGKVKVHVKVAGSGAVTGVSVETTPDPALGTCVAGVLQSASFTQTQHGGSFAYPFVF
jgi:predicted Zn finger-like uncharacterized protein